MEGFFFEWFKLAKHFNYAYRDKISYRLKTLKTSPIETKDINNSYLQSLNGCPSKYPSLKCEEMTKNPLLSNTIKNIIIVVECEVNYFMYEGHEMWQRASQPLAFKTNSPFYSLGDKSFFFFFLHAPVCALCLDHWGGGVALLWRPTPWGTMPEKQLNEAMRDEIQNASNRVWTLFF